MLGSANLGPSVFFSFFTITLSNVICLLQNFVHSVTDNVNEYCKFLISCVCIYCGYTICRRYVRFSHNICTHEKVETIR